MLDQLAAPVRNRSSSVLMLRGGSEAPLPELIEHLSLPQRSRDLPRHAVSSRPHRIVRNV